MKRIVILLAIWSLVLNLQAQEINFEHLGSKDGLSQISVLTVYQDELGYMWFGTAEGLNRYDGKEISVLKSIENDSTYLKSNIINKICGNNDGKLYLICGYRYLMSYDLKMDKFRFISDNCQSLTQGKKNIWYSSKNKVFQIFHNDTKESLYFTLDKNIRITKLYEGSNNKLFIGTENGLCMLDENKIFNKLLSGISVESIFEDSKKNIWIGTKDQGVYKMSWSGEITHFQHASESSKSLSSNLVRDFCEDNFGQIWIATFKGLDKFSPENGSITNYKHAEHKPTTLSHASVYAVYRDRQGTIWIGTYHGGINYFNPETNFYNYFHPSSNDPRTIDYPIVGKMTEDNNDNLWICTEGGGLNFYNRKTKLFKSFKSGGNSGLAHDNLKCIWFNKENGKLYIGTHLGGLYIYDSKKNNFRNISSKNTPLFPNDIVESIIEQGDHLVILTQKGLVSLNLKTDVIGRFFTNKELENKVGVDNITCFIDNKKNLWLAQTNGGLKRFNLISKELKVYNHRFNTSNTIGRQAVTSIISTKKGKLFFATMGSGLYEYIPENDNFVKYDTENSSLMSDYIYDLTETNYGYIVLLTNKGVNLFDAESKRNYYLDSNHGLPLEMINFGCGVFASRNGEIFVGGINGMVSFYESQINFSPKEYNLFFSDLIVNNNLVKPGDDSGILDYSLPYTNKLKLKYDQTNITIKFAISNNIKANRTKYEYRLDGFDDKWYPVNGQSIQYSNLNPDHYVLMVREKLPHNSTQKPKSIELDIIVTPPFYASTLAYLFYLLLIAGGIWWIIRFNKSKILLKTSLEYEIKEKAHIQDLNQAKLQFFTNISHDFRTPLSLIIGQIESLIQLEKITPFIHNRLVKIHKNASQLRILITELLDFRKQEHELLTLKVRNQDIVEFIKNIFGSFNDLATSRKIDYTFFSVDKNIMLWFDPIQLQKVFYNLISNAFKFSKDNSTISIKVEKISNLVRITINDSGIGISEEDLPHIFDRFYQSNNQHIPDTGYMGTGIGLSLAKGIVDLHHGTISVEQRPNGGTQFRVNLLIGNDHFTSKELEGHYESDFDYYKFTELPEPEFIEEIIQTEEESMKKKNSILIVEDNEEMLQFLSELFKPIYDIYTAIDGVEGLELLKTIQPDIILSDVMMPRMTGKEMCNKIKTNFETSHIPVVLLTADSSEELTLEGLMVGADDYITKPFNVKMLISRCNNLVLSRKRIQEKFSRQIDNTSISIATNKLDQDFINKATQIITNHIDDYDFNVTTFAQEMALGRSKLYLKLKGTTGMTPNDFILNIRLKTAANLLSTETELNISDITYKLGFNTPRYFSKCFKDLFGISPMSYRKQNNPAFSNNDVIEEEEDPELDHEDFY